MKTIQQTAELLGFSRQYVYLLVRLNKLKALKIGKVHIIEDNAISDYLKSYRSKKQRSK